MFCAVWAERRRDKRKAEEIEVDNIRTGKRIAELRKSKGLTQQELAERLNLSNKTISKWETGAGSPDISNLLILAEALNVSVDELLRGELETEVGTKCTDSPECETKRASVTADQRKARAIIALAACAGAVLGILAYNFGWLG